MDEEQDINQNTPTVHKVKEVAEIFKRKAINQLPNSIALDEAAKELGFSDWVDFLKVRFKLKGM